MSRRFQFSLKALLAVVLAVAAAFLSGVEAGRRQEQKRLAAEWDAVDGAQQAANLLYERAEKELEIVRESKLRPSTSKGK
ncbi:MAG TPA: hypothetical protein VG125_30305 [Pirellulales bacterium]|jgi:hypothetical protein|nr:hypothetical protein [Pirellulales bacterium]